MFIVYCCFETSRRAIYIHRQRQHNDNGLWIMNVSSASACGGIEPQKCMETWREYVMSLFP